VRDDPAASTLSLLWWNASWQHRGQTDDQIAAVLGLRRAPTVIGLCELTVSTSSRWRSALETRGYRVLADPPGLPSRHLRVLLAARSMHRDLGIERFGHVRHGALRGLSLQVHSTEVDVYAVHIPNGSVNGWEKIDHLESLRRGFGEPQECPQVLCGDFNTPQLERDGESITFGQLPDGELRQSPPAPKPFRRGRPWDPVAWDRGERAVLEGLRRDCGMPDAFHVVSPGAVEPTWVPRGGDEASGRRLDHVFASSSLTVKAFAHLHDWRRAGLSDHSAIEVAFELP